MINEMSTYVRNKTFDHSKRSSEPFLNSVFDTYQINQTSLYVPEEGTTATQISCRASGSFAIVVLGIAVKTIRHARTYFTNMTENCKKL